MKRKALIFMIAALLCLSVGLSGCGDSDDSSAESSKPVAESSEAESDEASSESTEDSSEAESSEQSDAESENASSESSEDSSAEETSEESSVSTEDGSADETSEEVSESEEESLATESSEESSANSEEELPAEMEYSVSVKAPDGSPMTSGVIVKFMQDGEQVSMQVPNANGVATKTLPTGDYTVELAFTGNEFFYEKSDLSLSGRDTSLTINLCNNLKGEAFTLYTSNGEFDAYDVEAGQTLVSLAKGMNYFVFTPTVAGTYEITPSVDNASMGYYGSPHFVQSNNVGEILNNTLTISVHASSISTAGAGTTQLVLGLNAEEAVESCVLSIIRTGNAALTIEDLPWDIYKTTATLAPYTLPAGAKLTNFDLTADTAYNLVYNENDGFYHLDSTNGPLVMVWLAKDPAYMACFKTILDRSGVSRYFFDDNGNCTRRENYSNCLLEYIECADENQGVYPLTKDLEYIIKQRGDYVGWWDSTSSGYIFHDRNGNPDLSINADNAWLFMCCYIG